MGQHLFYFSPKAIYSRLFLLSFLVALLSINGFSQAYEGGTTRNTNTIGKSTSSKQKGFDLDRVVLGGNLGAQFGDITFIDISPTVGYLFTENLLAGIGVRYIYFREESIFLNYQTNMYGGNVFGQYYFLENFLAHVEYERLNRDDRTNLEKRVNVDSFFVGGGYRSSIGGNSFASVLLLYNLNDDINSPYSNPVFRVNFGFGL